MDNTDGTQSFAIGLDLDGLRKSAEEAKNAFKGIGDTATKDGERIDDAFHKVSQQVKQEAGAIETAFKRAFAEAGNMKLSELKSSINTQVTYLKELEQKYKDVSDTVKNLPFSPKKTEMTGTLKNLKKEIDEEKAALDGLRAKYSEMTSGSVESFRMKLMQITNQLMAMRLAGEQNTQEYKELEKEMGRLATVMREVQQTRMADSTGATQWHGMIEGLQGLMGAYSVGSGIIGMFTKDQEKLMQIQTKMQSVMGVLMGMQQIANTLHSTSTFRLRTLKAVTDLWNTANTKAAAGLRALGVSAGVANVASKALMATLSLGLSVAIGAVIGLLNKLANKHAEARKKAEESAKAQQEAFENYADSVASHSTDILSKFEKLRRQYDRLGDNLDAKKKFVKDNADAFKELGVKVLDVHDADNLFIRNTEAFRQAVMLRAQALAGEELAAEKYKEAIQKRVEAENTMWRASGSKARYAGLSQEQQEQAQEKYRTAYDKYFNDNYTSKLAEKDVMERGELEKQKENIKRAAQETGNAAAQCYIDGLKTELKNGAGVLEAEADKVIETALNMGESAREKLRNAGIIEADGKGTSGGSSDAEKEEERRQKAINDAKLKALEEANKAELDLERSRITDKIALLEFDKEQELKAIDERIKAAKSAEEKAALERTRSATETGYNEKIHNERQAADARQIEEERQAMNEYLKEYGTFRERIQAIKDMYDKRISEAKTEGERMAAEAELAEILAAYELEMSGFVDGLIGKTSEQLETMLAEARSQLDAAKEKFDKLDSSSTSEAKQYKETINQLEAQIKALESQLGKAKKTAGDKDWTKAADLFQAIGSGARDAAESIRGLDEGLADVLTTIANLTSGVGGLVAAIGAIKGALTAAEKASAILAAISAAVSVVSGLFSIFGGGETSMERNIRLFRELNDELVRLKREAAINSLEDTIFGADRYRNAAENMKAYTDAMARYQEKLEEIRTRGTEVSGFGGTKGFVKSLDKEKANLNLYAKTWESAEESIANMKVQTRHSTWFRSAKYASLGSLLPDLFNDDGSLNMEALKEFQGNDLYKKLTEDNRKMIDDLIADWDLYQEALDEVKSYLSDIFGELGDTMTDALVDAFKNGTDAAQAFTDSVSKMLEDLAKDMIYSVTLAPLIDKAQKDMLAVMGDADLADEEKFKKYTQILDGLMSGVLSEQDNFNRLLSEYQEAAKRNGFDLFSPDDSERTATAKGLAQASQDSVDELNGRFTAIQGHTFEINENVERLAELQQIHLPLLQNLSYLATIDENTYYCRRLDGMDADLRAIKNTLENIEIRGITVKA